MKKRYVMILAGIAAAMMILGGCGAYGSQNGSSSREQELESQINDLEQQINELKNGQTDQNTGNAQNGVQQAADVGQSQGNTQNNADGNSGNTSDVKISLEEAQNIALARVQGATASDISIELDRDDGWYLYEGEIKYNGMEYEFEIDANSGNIVKWEEEKW